jgi:hypothetical protein
MRAVKDSLPTENVKNQKTLFDGRSRTNTGVVPREKNKIRRSMRMDLLCSCNARSQKVLAWATGTSRRASRWAGEKAARSGRSIRPLP